MITVSLVYELQFIAASLGEPFWCDLRFIPGGTIQLNVFPNLLYVHYNGELIWKEKLATPDSNFGIESCTTIYQIINEIRAGNADWKSKYKHDFS